MSRFRDGIYPLALRASQAAAMLGISESQLRQWVIEGKVHKPYRLRKNVVLFDAVTLASDWDRMKEEAEASSISGAVMEVEEEGPNPWDNVLR
jgi:HEPN domain-containing protein